MKKSLILCLVLALVSCMSEETGPKVGSEGILDSGVEQVVVSNSQETRKEFKQALNANDTHGIAGLLRSGKIFTVPKGTKALVIDSEQYMKKVRILEGKGTGLAGWVPMEHVK